MLRILQIWLLTFLMQGCRNNEPSGILPKEKMEAVLWDVAQGGEFLTSYVYFREPQLNRAAISNTMLQRVLKIHNITRQQFDKSLQYYSDHPKELKAILDSITTKNKKEPEASGKDSAGNEQFSPQKLPLQQLPAR